MKRTGGNDKELPLYGSGSHSRGINVFSWSFFKSSMQTILSQRDSRYVPRELPWALLIYIYLDVSFCTCVSTLCLCLLKLFMVG